MQLKNLVLLGDRYSTWGISVKKTQLDIEKWHHGSGGIRGGGAFEHIDIWRSGVFQTMSMAASNRSNEYFTIYHGYLTYPVHTSHFTVPPLHPKRPISGEQQQCHMATPTSTNLST
jgi:hypothetical protein